MPNACKPGPTLTLTGGSVGSYTGTYYALPTSFPVATGTLHFSTSNQTLVLGQPILTGSDGSTIIGGQLSTEGIQPPGSEAPEVDEYIATISGLHANVTYRVNFQSLTADPTFSGTTAVCTYPAEMAGSFQTGAT